MEGAREVTVVPVANEIGLRQRDWVEGNRRKVDELSGGRLAYVWVPDTGCGGYTYFTRYYFAQQDKQGAIIDERFNHGGSIADYMVDLMSRELLGYFNNPVGDRQPFTAPNAAIWGPKVMIINEMSGSGGDMLPYMFRKMEIGPLVGTRTWGGLVGIWDVPGADRRRLHHRAARRLLRHRRRLGGRERGRRRRTSRSSSCPSWSTPGTIRSWRRRSRWPWSC